MAMAIQNSPLCCIPTEILERIVLDVVLSTPLGPPADLIPILCFCKQINEALRFDNNSNLYARIFKGMFDVGAARRRFGPRAVLASNLADQLKLYCVALQDIRDGDIYSDIIKYTLWTAFFMMSENDGKNRAQLGWARLDDFINRRVRIMLFDCRGEFQGWPLENEENSLALWLMAMNLDEDNLLLEDNRRREQLVALLLPYVTVTCRYPSALAPPNHYGLPLVDAFEEQFPHSVVTAQGPYPLYRDPEETVHKTTHYGQTLKIGAPLISIAAKILYFTRRQIRQFPVPHHLPVNRAHAFELGKTEVGPTQADFMEFNAFKSVQFPAKTKWDWWADLTEQELELEDEGIWHHQLKANSAKFDHDWERMRHCLDPWTVPVAKGPVFKFGSLHGLWHGRLIVPSEPEYQALVATPDYPIDFSEQSPFISTIPFYMRLREHHCISPCTPMRAGGKRDGFNDGFFNAYFPPSRREETPGFLNIIEKRKSHKVWRYETYVPGQSNSHDEDTCLVCMDAREEERVEIRRRMESPNCDVEAVFENMGLGGGRGGEPEGEDDSEDYVMNTCNGIQDIVVTGTTDPRHGQAWNHYEFYGRVRTWDGLIVILRVPLQPDNFLGRWVFAGYLVAGQNFVGNWRAIGDDVGVPTWESAFIMSRRED